MGNVVFNVKAPEGALVPGAAILAAYPNRTYVTDKTDADGQCHLNLYRTDQEMTVLIAAKGYLPFHSTIVPRDQPEPFPGVDPLDRGSQRSTVYQEHGIHSWH